VTYGLIVSKVAEADIQDTYLYYESCRQGLGQEFMLTLEAAMASITRNPGQYRAVYKNVRRLVLNRFPYSIFFIYRQSQVIVLAVMHARRDPALWQRRQQN
jgi:plasmid stabilization system protein ParE